MKKLKPKKFETDRNKSKGTENLENQKVQTKKKPIEWKSMKADNKVGKRTIETNEPQCQKTQKAKKPNKTRKPKNQKPPEKQIYKKLKTTLKIGREIS